MTHLRAAVLSCLAVDCCNENMFFRGCVFFGVTIRFYSFRTEVGEKKKPQLPNGVEGLARSLR